MYTEISQFDAPADKIADTRQQRVKGRASLSLKAGPHSTRLDRLFQDGGAKIRLPKTGSGPLEAVLINTAGGLTGGDRLDWRITLASDTSGVATTQACERIYRSTGEPAQVETAINVGENARFGWLPQETILFEGSSLARSLNVELTASSRFVAIEAIIMGRHAMGEKVTRTYFRDRWRIRRNGRMIHADDVSLDGNITRIEEAPALLAGNRAFASMLYIGPEDDDWHAAIAGKMRKMASGASFGVSSFNGKIVARLLAADSYQLRAILVPILKILRAGEPLPRVWEL